MPSFLRFASVAATLLAVLITGRAQGQVPRATTYSPQGYPQGIPVSSTPAPAPQERMSVVDPDKKLTAGDQVTLEIVEDREGGLPRVVTATGELDVPPLGRVKVSGKTAADAASEIKQLLERDYYFHATVRLAIDRLSPVQVRQGLVYLSGEVRMMGPQEIVAGETLTLCNAILKAGGIGEWGNPKKVKLMRQKNGATETTEVNFKEITATGDVKKDPVLQDGDRIFVPRIYVKF